MSLRMEKEKGTTGERFLSIVLISTVIFLFVGMPILAVEQYDILFSTDEDFSLNLLLPTDDNLVYYSAGSYDISSLLPHGTLPPEVNIDALSIVGVNTVVFSLDEDAVLPGVGLVADEDLISFNGSTFTLWWDGSANGLPPEVNLDAVHVISPTEFLFSLEEDAVLPGVGLVADEDVIRFSGGTFSLELDGSAIGLPPEVDIDAVAILPNAIPITYILSIDGANEIAGTLYDDADLIAYSMGSFSKFFDAAANGIPPEVNINALAILGKTDVPDWIHINR